MLRVTVCCLLATSVLATDYANYMGQKKLPVPQDYGRSTPFPMDYYDDIYNRNILIKPNDHLIYNFEQIRRDQPPQVEIRDESIGRYMYRRPAITTPEPKIPQIKDFTGVEELPRLPSVNRPVPTYNDQHWNYMSALPSTIPPPPPTPKWADLSETLNKQTQKLPQHQTKNWNIDSLSPVVNQQKYQNYLPQYQPMLSTPAPAPSLHWTEPMVQEFNRKPAHPAEPAVSSFPNIMPTTAKPGRNSMADTISQRAGQKQFPPQAPQLSTNRGSHKFNWNDIAQEPQQVIQTTTIASGSHQGRNPPPPVPTLTPWLDGFGK